MDKSLICYIVYKIRNEVNFFFRRKTVSLPMLSLFGVVPKKLSHILFDLSDPTTHLGDRLFFFPLISQLFLQGYCLSLNPRDHITRQLFIGLYGVDPFAKEILNSIDLVVIPKPSFLNSLKIHRSILVVNFSDIKIVSTITHSLVMSFMELFGLNAVNADFPLATAPAKDLIDGILEQGEKYYLFSNYIQSGIFRKWFLSEDSMYIKCMNLKSDGYKIIHVGSTQDLLSDQKSYSMVDIDLRGRLSLDQFIGLIGSNQVFGAVTYDNFLMHLIGLMKKKAFVLFRGRFSYSACAHHFNYVNNTFFSSGNEPHYLK